MAIAGKFLIGVGTNKDSNNESKTFSANQTGGEYNHTLNLNEIPSHSHLIRMRNAGKWNWNDGNYAGDTLEGGYHWSGSPETFNWLIDTKPQGGNQKHNNIPPYLAVYMWQRTG